MSAEPSRHRRHLPPRLSAVLAIGALGLGLLTAPAGTAVAIRQHQRRPQPARGKPRLAVP